eukprot:scaffold3241_cov140-Alexandrium_tamarense.AAC.2
MLWEGRNALPILAIRIHRGRSLTKTTVTVVGAVFSMEPRVMLLCVCVTWPPGPDRVPTVGLSRPRAGTAGP